ncbi:HepT-like ribonuclease domain-containing protein [Rhodocyclaceae bacterium SMB388]
MKKLRDADYLEHIRDAISKIQRFTDGKTEADFRTDDLIQDAVIRNLEVIGEAVTKLSPELKQRHDDVRWNEIAGMRNRLIHAYMNVNLEIVWNTVMDVLPSFLRRISNLE